MILSAARAKHRSLGKCRGGPASGPGVQRKVSERTLHEVTEPIIGEVHVLTQAVLISGHMLSTTEMWGLDGKIIR